MANDPSSAGGPEMLSRAREVSESVLAPSASAVDAENRFPTESVDAMREAGMLGYFIPESLGGVGGDVRTYARMAETLGGACLSSAMIWVMHAHQVAVVARHRTEAHEPHLATIAQQGRLLASVTSEYGKGGDVLKAEAPIVRDGERLRLTRRAPVVSYGEQAGYYLVTMRSAADVPTTDVSLVLVEPTDGQVSVTGQWDAMGLHGTRSVPMEFDVTVDPDRVVGPFRQAALQTLVPAAQVGWTAAWYGAAKAALERFAASQRRVRGRGFDSDLFVTRLAELRVQLDLVQAMLEKVAARLDTWWSEAAPLARYEDATHNILINNLKVAGSRAAFAVVDGIIAMAGMASGYTRDHSGLERVFRDLRSAALMFGNDRLLQANGKLMLVEGSPIHRIWS